MAKFSGFEKTGLKPLNFIRIAKFELFGAKMAKFSGFEARPETREFYLNG